MKTSRTVAILALALCATAARSEAQRLTLTTTSPEAKTMLAQIQKNIESLQFGDNVALANKIVAADPNFALGVYYVSAVNPPPDNQKALEKSVELSKNASDGERRFIEALVLARSSESEKAIAPLTQLAKEFPDERVIHNILGQVLSADGQVSAARAEYQKAIALDPTTPRAYTFLGNLLILEGKYGEARQAFNDALTRIAPGVPPGGVRYPVAFTYIYEGQPDKAITTLRGFVDEYTKAGSPFGIPEVFIWNSIARINLENGRYEEALAAYKKGYESVPGSDLDAEQKQIWLGRLHHGQARTWARMGKYDAAWKEADTVKKMIADGGDRGKQFEPAYHYLAGYISLAQGKTADAIEHLKQAQPDQDPFRALLLARAYEKAGDKANAKKSYEMVVKDSSSSIERALSYNEAKKKLATL
jgi:tetratricopeptide (TPR) repeat protein